MNDIHSLMEALNEAGIHFRLASHRDGAVMAIVSVPGQRWEVEIFPDGEVEVEIFKSDGTITGVDHLVRLIDQFKD